METGRTTKKILQRLVCQYSHHQIPRTLPSLHKPLKSFWLMFEKPENAVDVSKCLANLSSFAARVCKSSIQLPRLEEVELSSLLRNADCCSAMKQFTLMRSFKISRFSLTLALWMLIFSLRCSLKDKVFPCAFKSLATWFWMWFVDFAYLLRLLGRFFISHKPVVVHTLSLQFSATRFVGYASDAI